MSGKEETPRQKMIGMMYLVLTAMLAMNVSVEVLKSFVTVNEALEATNENYHKKNATVYNMFEKAYLANESKVGEKWMKAQQVKAESERMYNYLDTVKIKLMAASEHISFEEASKLEARKLGRQDNYDDPTRFFMGTNENDPTSGEAYYLKKNLKDFRRFLESMLDEDDQGKVDLDALCVDTLRSIRLEIDRIEKEGLKVSDAAMDSLLQKLELRYENAAHDQLDWAKFHFYHTIIVADLAILNKLQASVLNAENDVVSQLFSSVSEDDFKFDNIAARVVPVSTNVLSGSQFEAEVFVAAYDSKSEISAVINGQTYKGENGTIKYKVPAGAPGERKMNGIINVPGAFGVKSYPFNFSYHVSQATATVAATKMNVFYVGVDNPVSALGGGVADQYTQVEMTNGTISKTGPGEYNVRVTTPGAKAEIRVYSTEGGKKTLMGSREFRIKRVPNPEARINGQEVGVKQIDKNTLANAGGLLVSMKDFDFELKLSIASFNVQVSRDGELSPSMPSNGNKFTQNMIDNFKRCKRGDKVFITDVYAQMPDGKRALGDMILTIK